MCARQKQDRCGDCHESRSLDHMFAGQWSLPLSTVKCSRSCIDTIRPSVPVRLWCGLCRLVFRAICNASEAPFWGTTSFKQHGFDAAILLHQHVPACFVSIALHVFNRHVFQQTLRSNSWRCAQDDRFAWALQCSNRIRMSEDTTCQISKVFREVCSSQSMTT